MNYLVLLNVGILPQDPADQAISADYSTHRNKSPIEDRLAKIELLRKP